MVSNIYKAKSGRVYIKASASFNMGAVPFLFWHPVKEFELDDTMMQQLIAEVTFYIKLHA